MRRVAGGAAWGNVCGWIAVVFFCGCFGLMRLIGGMVSVVSGMDGRASAERRVEVRGGVWKGDGEWKDLAGTRTKVGWRVRGSWMAWVGRP